MRKRWQLQKNLSEKKALAQSLSQDLDLPLFAAMLAVLRGVQNEESLPAFLGETEPIYCNPYDLPDMEQAVIRIAYALEQGQPIAVYGDYDCDGVTATALLYTYFREKTEYVAYYLPDRHGEGYGMSIQGIDELHARGCKLIVTVDNGISALREIDHANALGIDVVVTDHHQPGHALPNAIAVVNPHRKDCDLPFRAFAGVGVAFLLMCAMEGCEPEELLPIYGDFTALGTVADLVDLAADNRAFVRAGLDVINENPRPWVSAMRRIARCDTKPLSAVSLAFTLAPRINAAGRMEHANYALALLLAKTIEEAEPLAQQLEQLNADRQGIERAIETEAIAWLESNPNHKNDRVMVFAGEGWHAGVIGIVAARMTERLGRPCFIVAVVDGIGTGSGRSIEGFSLFEALQNSDALFIKYGGHAQAAGLTIAAQDIDRFRSDVNAYAMAREMPLPTLRLDMKLNAANVTTALTDQLAMLEPFGTGNPQPVFALQNMRLVAITPLSNGKHLKLLLEQGEKRLSALQFHKRREDFLFEPGDELDLAVTLETNEYNGQRSVSMFVQCVKHHRVPNEMLLRAKQITENVLRGETIDAALAKEITPVRSDFAAVYRLLQKTPNCTPERLFLLLQCQDAAHMTRVWLAVKIFCEMGLLREDMNERVTCNAVTQKTNLEDAPLFKQLVAIANCANYANQLMESG
ncbi:MAG: single-stranded-DNA-specific exonuclease RecJ [Oscillospiraceae bacterium]|nr:single-stranded-DNA-specific exonuclease RecJ [Oscillospiraceae bacterium]